MKTLFQIFFLIIILQLFTLTVNQRIIGGFEVQNITETPYQLSLRINGYHRCGASIISATWALSAGHCLNPNYPVDTFTILAGVLSLKSAEPKNIFYVAEFHRHPNYTTNYDYDVAVARVTRSFFELPLVKATRLSTQDMPLVVGELSLVSGWGITLSGYESDVLLKVQVPIISEEMCFSYWGSYLTDRMVCAGIRGSDTCQGDSGGPLIFRNLQVGIISYGPPDCGTSVPGVYSAISHPSIRQFIRRLTGV
uniref:CSON010534 protein n=1 Tax=Culicoides sonorensis TaxID=179676 RepID=A0A336LQ32_CULSO